MTDGVAQISFVRKSCQCRTITKMWIPLPYTDAFFKVGEIQTATISDINYVRLHTIPQHTQLLTQFVSHIEGELIYRNDPEATRPASAERRTHGIG